MSGLPSSERFVHAKNFRLLGTEDFPDVTDRGERPLPLRDRVWVNDKSNVAVAAIREESAAVVQRPADHLCPEFAQQGGRPLGITQVREYSTRGVRRRLCSTEQNRRGDLVGQLAGTMDRVCSSSKRADEPPNR